MQQHHALRQSRLSGIVSAIMLMRVISHNCVWLLSRSIRMVFILNKEMVSYIIRGRKANANVAPEVQNVFNHHGVWLVDMEGLIHEQMDLR